MVGVQCSGRAGEKVDASSHDMVVPQVRKCCDAYAGYGTDVVSRFARLLQSLGQYCICERLMSTVTTLGSCLPLMAGGLVQGKPGVRLT